jgi:hypothetical protein
MRDDQPVWLVRNWRGVPRPACPRASLNRRRERWVGVMKALDASQKANSRLACATNLRGKRNAGFREGRRTAKAQYFCSYMIVIVDGWTQEVSVLIHGAFSDAPRRAHRQ